MSMFVKRAAANDDAVADRLLRQIHDENPSFWPHGLTRGHFDGGLYLLSKQAGMEPVGFVGWQERDESGRKVGYYSVGVLPEHRRKEYAKRAISAVLREKSAGVDEVRAMVVSGNLPSSSLAKSLDGVTLLEKEANLKASIVSNLAAALAGGTGTMLMQDNMMHPSEPLGTQAFRPGENDKTRNLMNVVNFVLGAGGALGLKGGVGRIGRAAGPAGATMVGSERATQIGLGMAQAGAGVTGMTAGPIFKDVGMDSHRAIEGIDRLSKDLPAALIAASGPAQGGPAAGPTELKIPDAALYGGLGLGVAGLGTALLIARMKRKAALSQSFAEAARSRQGRIQVALPEVGPNGARTTLDLPADDINLSQVLEARLRSDTKSRLRLALAGEQARSPRTRKTTRAEVDEDTGQVVDETPAEEPGFIDRILQAFGKSAGAAPAVPSPPAQGTNPAMRMSQEAQTAQQAAQGAGTEGNPQIAAAEQSAAAAEQQVQQQIAQAQQTSQQEAMQRDQAHAAELVKKDQEVFQAHQEVEIQKMQVEKAKVEVELAKAKMDADKELEENRKSITDAASSGDDSAVHRMTKHRLARIRSTVSKVAALAPGASHTFEAPASEVKELLPSTAQRINDRGNEFQAYGGLVRPRLARASYGKLGDMAYGRLVRPWLMTPPQDTSGLAGASAEMISANPDAFDSMLRVGQGVLNSPR